MKDLIFEVPKDFFKIEHKFELDYWSPGVWAGTEGLQLTITKVDLEKRVVTLQVLNEKK